MLHFFLFQIVHISDLLITPVQFALALQSQGVQLKTDLTTNHVTLCEGKSVSYYVYYDVLVFLMILS